MNILKIAIFSRFWVKLTENKILDKKIIEAHLWIKKYFIVFSNAIPDSLDMIGRKANILNSKATHIPKAEGDLKANKIVSLIKM